MTNNSLPNDNSSEANLSSTSVGQRYATTLLVQFAQLGLSAFTAGLVPSTLGPVNYGNFNFLLNTASTIRNLLDLGTQQAFFTFSSQKQASGPLTKLYAIWVSIQLIVLLGIIGIANAAGLLPQFWPHQKLTHIVLISILEWLIFVALTFRQLADSKGVTVHAQFITLSISVLNTAALIALVLTGRLNLHSYVFLGYFSAIGGCIALGAFLIYHKNMTWSGRLQGWVKKYIHRWWRYASPLIAGSAYGAILNYAETFMIQRFYGSTEQAYFALANRWSAIVLVFTSSALTIYWREMANLLSVKNVNGAAQIYDRFNSVLFSLAIILAWWLCMNAKILISIILGPEYSPAVPVLMLMAFYPVQQTFGQLTTVAFLASERTLEYRNFGIIFSLISLPLTYLLLAPKTAVIPGLNLGAYGAALKMVGYGLITVQFLDWSNCKFFGISFARKFAQKSGFAMSVGIFSFVMFHGLGAILQTRSPISVWVFVVLESGVYFGLLAICIHAYPRIIGIQREELNSLKNFFKKRLFGR